MSKWIVDIHGDIEGDYEIIKKYEEPTEGDAALQELWIPINKRFPEEGKTVIASTEYGVFPEARYIEKYGWEWAYESGADYWQKLEDVTAWMPLPERYKPQESEDKDG